MIKQTLVCDVCGEVFEPYVNLEENPKCYKRITVVDTSKDRYTYNHISYDLCEDCFNNIDAILNPSEDI